MMEAISPEQIEAVEAVRMEAGPTPEAEQEPVPMDDERGAQSAPGPGEGPRPGPDRPGPGASQEAGQGEVLGYSWQDQTRECVKLSEGAFGATAATCDLLDAPFSLTDAEVKELGEIWGNVLRHFIEIREGEKKADLLRAYGETAIIARRKVSEMDRGEGRDDG